MVLTYSLHTGFSLCCSGTVLVFYTNFLLNASREFILKADMAPSLFTPSECSLHCTKQTVSFLNIYSLSFSLTTKQINYRSLARCMRVLLFKMDNSQVLAACFPEAGHLHLK